MHLFISVTQAHLYYFYFLPLQNKYSSEARSWLLFPVVYGQ